MTEKEEWDYLNHIGSAYFDILRARRLYGKEQNEMLERAYKATRELYREATLHFWNYPGRLERYLQKVKKERP